MTKSIAGIAIPDSKLSTEAADALREYGTPLLWNHSHRVFLFGSLLGRRENLKYDPELLYISALFHDLGLTRPTGCAMRFTTSKLHCITERHKPFHQGVTVLRISRIRHAALEPSLAQK